jgi:hypothetical protein
LAFTQACGHLPSHDVGGLAFEGFSVFLILCLQGDQSLSIILLEALGAH